MIRRAIRTATWGSMLVGLGVGARPAAAQCVPGAALHHETQRVVTHLTITQFGPQTVLLPAWDPAAHVPGSRLVEVELEVHLEVFATLRVENINNWDCTLDWNAYQEVELSAPPELGPVPDDVHALVGSHRLLPSFDGVIDFGGTSGYSWVDTSHGNSAPLFVADDPAILRGWIGGGDRPFTISGAGVMAGSSPCHFLQIEQFAGGVLTMRVQYTWCEPELGLAYCFGDGAGVCPCGNTGPHASGCANSTGDGARLVASGSASVAADDLAFSGSGMVPGKPGLLFAGLNATNGGSGAPFGDGLRCAGGDLRRLGIRFADGNGAASYGPGLAALGGLAAGETRRFQLWYRDPGGPCGSGFDLSHGVELALEP